MKTKKLTKVLGFPFSKWGMKDTVEYIVSCLHQDRQQLEQTVHIVTANPEIVMFGLEDEKLRQVMLSADLITPDGTGVVWAAELLGDPVQERVAGVDMLTEIFKTSAERPFSVFLFGASEEVNSTAARNLSELYPQLQVAGRRNGYYDEAESEQIFAEINAAQPDLILVALGCPKQEFWIHAYKNRLQAKVAIGVGGSLDIISGAVKRAPLVWRKLRLEWLHRLLSNPSRWRRQLALPQFVLKVKAERKRQLQNK